MLRYLSVDIVCSESKQTVFQVQVNLKLLEICEPQGVGNVQRQAHFKSNGGSQLLCLLSYR